MSDIEDVLERYATGFDAQPPPFGTLRRRAQARRRRRLTVGVAVLTVLVVGSITGRFMRDDAPVVTTRPDRLTLAPGVVLHDAPPWVSAVETVPLRDPSAQEKNGYRYRIRALVDSNGDERIVVHVIEGDPFVPEFESRLTGGIVSDVHGLPAVEYLVGQDADQPALVLAPVDGVVIRLFGDSPEELRRVASGLEITPSPAPLPGEPRTVARGSIGDVPWQFVMTTYQGRPCEVIRVYTSAVACAQRPVDPERIEWSDLGSFAELAPDVASTIVHALVPEGTSQVEVTLSDGSVVSADLYPVHELDAVLAIAAAPLSAHVASESISAS